MKKTFEILKNNPLFYRVAFNDFERMMDCLSAKVATYKKNEIILLSGNPINFVGLILAGSIKIIKEDMKGNITILSILGVSETFGEAFACVNTIQSPITIQAIEDTEVLFIDYKRIITSCTSTCSFHAQLIANMLRLIAHRNIMLDQRVELLSKRTTRDKLSCFFDIQRGSFKKFTISFSREELASFLCVDRSAMSNELSKMRDEGLIKFKKNSFEVFY